MLADNDGSPLTGGYLFSGVRSVVNYDDSRVNNGTDTLYQSTDVLSFVECGNDYGSFIRFDLLINVTQSLGYGRSGYAPGKTLMGRFSLTVEFM